MPVGCILYRWTLGALETLSVVRPKEESNTDNQNAVATLLVPSSSSPAAAALPRPPQHASTSAKTTARGSCSCQASSPSLASPLLCVVRCALCVRGSLVTSTHNHAPPFHPFIHSYIAPRRLHSLTHRVSRMRRRASSGVVGRGASRAAAPDNGEAGTGRGIVVWGEAGGWGEPLPPPPGPQGEGEEGPKTKPSPALVHRFQRSVNPMCMPLYIIDR